jgi:hypothetical protein
MSLDPYKKSICLNSTISKDLTLGDKARQAGLFTSFAKRKTSGLQQRNTVRGGRLPVLEVQIPGGDSSGGNATIDSDPNHYSSGIILSPPSPSESALLSAGADGPPNPFARLESKDGLQDKVAVSKPIYQGSEALTRIDAGMGGIVEPSPQILAYAQAHAQAQALMCNEPSFPIT